MPEIPISIHLSFYYTWIRTLWETVNKIRTSELQTIPKTICSTPAMSGKDLGSSSRLGALTPPWAQIQHDFLGVFNISPMAISGQSGSFRSRFHETYPPEFSTGKHGPFIVETWLQLW